MYSTAKLKHGNKIVFVKVGNYFHTYSEDALTLTKLAKDSNTKLHLKNNVWGAPQVVFPQDKLDYYRACCYQKGMRVVVV
jgi:DNA mismatch repair ATPase MutS